MPSLLRPTNNAGPVVFPASSSSASIQDDDESVTRRTKRKTIISESGNATSSRTYSYVKDDDEAKDGLHEDEGDNARRMNFNEQVAHDVDVDVDDRVDNVDDNDDDHRDGDGDDDRFDSNDEDHTIALERMELESRLTTMPKVEF